MEFAFALPLVQATHGQPTVYLGQQITDALAIRNRLNRSQETRAMPKARAAIVTDLGYMPDSVRFHLRGSDVLGTMNGDRVAALLTHTDGDLLALATNPVGGRLVENTTWQRKGSSILRPEADRSR